MFQASGASMSASALPPTARGDLQESGPLVFVKISFQPNPALDLVEHPLFRLAILTIPGVNPPVTEPHLDALQCQFFSLRIHAECYGRSGSECSQQVFVGLGATIGAAMGCRLVSQEPVLSGFDLLGEPLSGHGAHNHI